MTTWRHKKRETEYEILHDAASLQCATEPQFESMFEDEHWIVYRNVKTWAVYVRLAEEFHDGRFERVADGEQAHGGKAADEIERLRAALKPFADAATEYQRGHSEADHSTVIRVTLGRCLEARRAVEQKEDGK